MHSAWGENLGKQLVDPAWVQSLVVAVQQVPQFSCGPHNVNLPTRLFKFPCHCVHVHNLILLIDGPREVWMAGGHSTGAPCPLWTHDTHLTTRPFHFTLAYHGHSTTPVPVYGTCPNTMTS